MTIFNSFTATNDYNLRFFLTTNKTFEGICLALEGEISSKGVVNSFCI